MSAAPACWADVRTCALSMRQRAGPVLVSAGWWTLGAIGVWVLWQVLSGITLDRIAPLPDPDTVAAGADMVSPLALLVTVAIRLMSVGVQLAVFCMVPLPALYGMAWICARALRGHPVSRSDIATPLRSSWAFAGVVVMLAVAVIVPFILWALAIVVAGVAIAVSAQSAVEPDFDLTLRLWWASVALAVPFVLASVWIQCRWIYAPLAVADGDGVRRALAMSWRITGSGRALVWTRIALAMLGWAIASTVMLVLPLAWFGLPRVAAYFAAGYVLGRDAAHSGHAGSTHGSQ